LKDDDQLQDFPEGGEKDMDLPSWLDLPKIAGLSVLTLAVVQYFKVGIPDKLIRYFSVLVGIALSFACELYIGAVLNPIKAAVNGLIATVTADTAYKFLSNSKSQSFSLPSKAQEEAGQKGP
jgi:hypothetical protein